MRNALLCLLLFATGAAGQQKRFDWVPASSQTLRLEPGRWQALAADLEGAIHLRIAVEGKVPVGMGVVRADDWNYAQAHPETMDHMPLWCPSEGLLHNSTFTCDLDTPPAAMVLVAHDERTPADALGEAVLVGVKAAAKDMVGPNDVTFTRLRWGCVENCNLPEYAWANVFKERFQLTTLAKSYGPLTPERDGNGIHIKMKSATPMLVAVLPLAKADQLRANPSQADTLLAGVACKQRAVQSANFGCQLNLQDGTQQVVLMPEPGVSVPRKKKAEINVTMVRCVLNCTAAQAH